MKHLKQLEQLLPKLGNGYELSDENVQACLEEVEAILRGSAVGRSPSISPSQTNQTVRQLWFVINGVTDVYNPDQFKPSSKMKMLFSSVCEHVLILLLKESGANIDVPKEPIHVEFTTPKGRTIKMKGTDDYRINDQVVDCKMPNEENMVKKFGSPKKLVEGDVFGYIPQANCYSKGAGKEFMGWDVCCTSTGKIKHVSAKNIDLERGMESFFNRYDEAVDAGDNIPDCQFKTMISWGNDVVFSFEHQHEYLNETGGVIPWNCSRCPWRDTCWKDLERIDKPNEVVRHKVK